MATAIPILVLTVASNAYIFVEAIRWMAAQPGVTVGLVMCLTANYMPRTLLFMLSTTSFGCVLLVIWFLRQPHGRAHYGLTHVGAGFFDCMFYRFRADACCLEKSI